METIIVYVDDADYAKLQIQAVMRLPHVSQAHWVLVACAPRITHRVSKFVNNRSRESWRTKWAERLFHACLPLLVDQVAKVSTVLARVPLPELLQSLQAEHGHIASVLDMRRPKLQASGEVQETAASPLRNLVLSFAGVSALWATMVGEVIAA